MPAGVPIVVTAAAGAIQGGIAGGASAWVSGAIIGGALGAGVGALGLITQDKPSTGRSVDDTIQTTSVRNLVVPVVFGRARIGGNYIALGNFWSYKTGKVDGSIRYHLMNAIIGLCEGPIQFAGNRLIEGKLEKNFDDDGNFTGGPYDAELEIFDAAPVGLSRDKFFTFHLLEGTDDQEIPGLVLDTGLAVSAGFTIEVDGDRVNATSLEPPVPWRNTAIEEVQAVVGQQARLIQVTRDVVGTDYAIRVTGSPSGTNFGDVAGYAYYDGYTEAFYHTVASSSGTSSPFGLVRISRTAEFGHQHTQPPTAVSSDVTKAWYLGRHDVLVMQDPGDDAKFWIGYWGISRGSANWECFTPDSDYAEPIEAEYLDELHGILHTLHEAADNTIYVMRWNLLTGRVERIDTDLPAPPYQAFMYSPDLDAYVVIDATDVLIISADSGETIRDTDDPDLTNVIGVCVAGARVGIIKNDSFIYWDPNDNSLETLGDDATTLVAGNFGGCVSARQNSWCAAPTDATTFYVSVSSFSAMAARRSAAEPGGHG